MKSLSIYVGVSAVFIGIFMCKFYVTISPDVPKRWTAEVLIFNAAFYFSYAGDTFGNGFGCTVIRSFLDAVDKLIGFLNLDELAVTVEDTMISGVPVRIYRPRNIVVHDQGRPGLIYFHGGGLILGSAKWNIYDVMLTKIANATDSVVISVDYRLAPEHLFPTQFQDCYSVVSTVIEERMKFGITNEKLVLGGESAGGLLAAAVTLELVKENRGNHIAAQLLVYPWLQSIDVTCLSSYRDHSHGLLIRNEEMAYFSSLVVTGKPDIMQQYLSGNISRYFMHTPYWKFLQISEKSDCKLSSEKSTENLPSQFIETVVDSRLSPLLTDTVEGLPPTFIAVAEYDVLASEGNLFADRLKKAGIQVVHKIYKSHHGFLSIGNFLPSISSFDTLATEAMQHKINYLNSVFYNN